MQGIDEREGGRGKKVGVCRLIEVFATQEVPSSPLTGFSAATGSLAFQLVRCSSHLIFLFFFPRACIDVIPTMPRCPTEFPKF